jgi:hypothetical protein
MTFPKAEFYLGETTNAAGVVSQWFFSRDGGSPHVIRVDGELHPETQHQENSTGDFTLTPESVPVDIKAFWTLTGIDRIQENARAYRETISQH